MNIIILQLIENDETKLTFSVGKATIKEALSENAGSRLNQYYSSRGRFYNIYQIHSFHALDLVISLLEIYSVLRIKEILQNYGC